MLVSDIYTEIRNEANTNSTKVSDAFLLTGVNLDYGEVVQEIIKVKTDFNFQAEEAYTNLVSTSGLVAGNNGYNGEYAFPSDLLRPIRVEISYDGITWRPAKFYDVADNLNYSEQESSDVENFSFQNDPYVRFERDSFFVRPTKTTAGNITAGIHIWYEKRQTALTAPDTPLFESNFHRILVLRGALRIMRKFRSEYTIVDRNEIKKELRDLDNEMCEWYKNRFKRSFRIQSAAENMK